MARVRVLMMQRDETVMLEPWFRYYGYLFGYDNLVVFDNGSVDPGVQATLARYARAGVAVVRDFADRAAFQRKGEILGAAIRHLDSAGDYDFALPVDCDEFIVALTGDGLSCRRGAVHAAFDAMIGRRHAFGIELSFYNVPGRTGWFFPDGNRKGFLAADTILDLDHGFHQPRSRVEDWTGEVSLAYLHFHNRPYRQMHVHAARKLDGLVDLHDAEALRRFQGPGHHLAGYFLMDEATYNGRYGNAPTVAVPEFVDLMAALGIAAEAIDGPAEFPPQFGGQLGLSLPARDGAAVALGAFDGAEYLARSTDVSASGMPPLYHYLLFGRGEGRVAPLVDHAPEAPRPEPGPGELPPPKEPRYSLVGDIGRPPPGAEGHEAAAIAAAGVETEAPIEPARDADAPYGEMLVSEAGQGDPGREHAAPDVVAPDAVAPDAVAPDAAGPGTRHGEDEMAVPAEAVHADAAPEAAQAEVAQAEAVWAFRRFDDMITE